MDIRRGIVCSLTDEKPEFEVQCPEYVPDVAAIDQQKVIEQNSSEEYWESDEKFGGKSIKGASWFHTIGVLSFINVLANFVGVAFIFGLGITQLLQLNLEIQIFSIPNWLCVVFMLLIPFFYVFVGYRTAAKQDAQMYIFGGIIYILDLIILLVFGFQTGISAVLIDIIVHAILILAGLSILFDDDFWNKLNVKKSWVRPISFIPLLILFFQIFIISSMLSLNIPEYSSQENTTISQAHERVISDNIILGRTINQINALLPEYERTEDGELVGRVDKWKFVDDKLCIVYTDFTITYDEYQELSKGVDLGAAVAEQKKSLIQTDAESLSFYKLLFDECYDMVYQYYSSDEKLMYEIIITSDDVESVVGEL